MISNPRNVETLGLSDSTPRSEGRLKTLFWPTIRNGTDVDTVASQGFWVCVIVGTISSIYLAATGSPGSGVAVFVLFFLGGVGVRERSRYSAAVMLFVYALDLFTSFSVIRIIVTALLLSNLRAAWIAARWKPESEEAVLPPRLDETWTDKLGDQLPLWLWPKVRIVFYVYSGLLWLGIFATVIMKLGLDR